MIYKNLRKELDKDEQTAKDQKYEKKMTEMEHKATLRQAEKRKQIIEVANEEEKKEAAVKTQHSQAKSFLDGIQTFKVE